MLREVLVKKGVGGEEDFHWRGEDVSRVEGLSDAVFAFSITLLVVSLEVPKTFTALLDDMQDFAAFAVCFFMLYQIWHSHYSFFRRYGLHDAFTLRFNAFLLFIVLSYVYPLKFLFTLLMRDALGFGTEVSMTGGGSVPMIEEAQWPLLIIIYAIGFVAVNAVFALLYYHAYSKKGELALTPRELSITRQDIQSFLLNALVGLVSLGLGVLSFIVHAAVLWAGLAYVLAAPAQALNGRIMRKRQQALPGTPESAGDAPEAQPEAHVS